MPAEQASELLSSRSREASDQSLKPVRSQLTPLANSVRTSHLGTAEPFAVPSLNMVNPALRILNAARPSGLHFPPSPPLLGRGPTRAVWPAGRTARTRPARPRIKLFAMTFLAGFLFVSILLA